MPGKSRYRAKRRLTRTRIFGFRAAHVFYISQTGGEPLPEFAPVKGDPQEFTARLKEAISERGITLDYSGKIAPAKGVSAGGAITVLPGIGRAEEFAVLVHPDPKRIRVATYRDWVCYSET